MIDVLLVEDEPDHAELVRDAWTIGCGWRIARHALSLSEAIACLEQEYFQAVLLDLNLGETRGLETLRRIQAVQTEQAIIVLTSLDNEQLARDAIRAGADDYIPKLQLSTELLNRTIRHALERNRLVQELKDTNQRLDDFASLAAHDLVAPLGRIASLADLLDKQRQPGTTGSPGDPLRLIVDECRRLSELTRDLLRFARTGRESMKLELTDLTECARQAVDSLSESIRATGARVHIEELPSASVDRAQITLLLQNLIENGLKYQPPGSRPDIHVTGAREPGQVRISVRDNGLGIAPEHHASIFESFRRVHGEEIPGSGLGLAHCARIVHAHRGTIGVDSAPGKGSLFWFTIPT